MNIAKGILYLVLCICVLPLNAEVGNLLCDNNTNPLAIDNASPHFSWINRTATQNDYQTAYEIEVASTEKLLLKGKADVWKSGKVESRESVMVPYAGSALHPRSFYYWRVRTWNSEGVCSGWSKVASFGVGILDTNDFHGDYITTTNPENTTPVFTTILPLRELGGLALLHLNSLGYHELYINGERVGEDVLAPAVSQLNKRSLIVTYNVTEYLQKGENTIAIWLGKGWYKKANFDNSLETPVVRAELDIITEKSIKVVASTDTNWRCNADGVGYLTDIGTWMPLQFGGERIDARIPVPRVDMLGTDSVKKVEITQTATPQTFPGNAIVNRLRPQKITRMSEGKYLIDLGQNITGWFSMDFHGLLKDAEVVMEYADDYTTEPQFSGEKDVFISNGNATDSFCNKFNHHAYRYVVVSGLAEEPTVDDIWGLQISANHPETTTFECSDSDINAIHDMIQRTLRCLTFSGYMVDCPHLERMGYGGDGNSSTMTLQTMQDAVNTYYNWVTAWADAQDEDGGMPHVAPAGGGGGGPYWCGFIIQASWRAYMNYGDDRLLVKYYGNMQRWLEYVEKYSPSGLLERWPDTKNRMWFLGDWLTPMGVDGGNERSVSLVSNCFVSECLESMTRIAQHLGKKADAERYSQWRERLNKQIHETFYNPEDDTYGCGSPLDMSYSMNAGVVPLNIYNKVREKLIELSRTKYNTHIAVGLVGVPVFTEWATCDAPQLMFDILKQPDYPGYMDMINHGATTTWEAWDRSRSRIHNCYNGIGTWFYQALAGIRPNPYKPGYREFFLSPQMPNGITWTKVTKETPYGTISVDVKLLDEKTLVADVEIPFGCSARILTPEGEENVLGSGKWTAIRFPR